MSLDYIDEDVAYLVGLILVRGQIHQSDGVKQLILDFPFRNLEVAGVKRKYNQRNEILLGLVPVRERINELLEVNLRQEVGEYSVQLIGDFTKNTIAWRNLRMLTQSQQDFKGFEIANLVFEAPSSIKKELLRGVADGAGRIDRGTNYYGMWHRVFIHIDNANWRLPVQICKLLQEHLRVPVHGIVWGHPNIRDPGLKDYQSGKKNVSFREHQLRIFCEAFQAIGFGLAYKEMALNDWMVSDKKKFGKRRLSFCNPTRKVVRRNQFKPCHPEEASERLPEALKGRHFNTYWEICVELGCQQGRNQNVC